MASLALGQSLRRRLLPLLEEIAPIPLLRSLVFPLPSLHLRQPPPIAFNEPRPKSFIATLLEDLFPSILLAVPKKKVSHSRKSMRSAHKGLKDKTSKLVESSILNMCWSAFYLDIVSCPACGQPKLAHNLCPACYSQFSRARKRDIVTREQRQ